MKSIDRPSHFKYPILLSLLLTALLALTSCTSPEKAKAQHVSRGEAFLKAEKYQEASIEFRNAIQIDDKLAAAHWGLAQAYEGLQRSQEMYDELHTTVSLDANNLDARVKLGNYDMMIAGRYAEALAEAEKLAKEILQKDPNHIEGHILTANVLFARGQKDQALVELNRAIELDPKRVESRLALARYYIASSDKVKAEEIFKNAITINGASALAYTEYGKFLIQADRGADAEAALRKAVEVEPTNRNSRFVLASFYLVTKQLDKAEEAYKALADLNQDKPEGRAVLGDFYSAVNRQADAIKIYQEILAKSPDYVQGRYRLSEIMLNSGDAKGAMAQIDELLKKDPRDRQALLLRARVHSQTGQTSEIKAAIEDLKEVLKQEPNSRAGLYFMAQADFSLGLVDEARVFAGNLERTYPDYLPAKLMQVQISLAVGDAKSAQQLATDLLAKLAKATPDRDTSPQVLTVLTGKAYVSRGSALVQLGNTQAARQDFLAAKGITPQDTDSYVNLAVVSLLENKPEEAVGFYEGALAVNPVSFSALNGLADLYLRQQQPDKALARVDQVLSANPNNPSLHFLKARIYGAQQNAQGSEAELRKTIELDPNYIDAYSALGALFVNTKQEDRAIAEFQKIVALRPDNAAAYTMIGMLEDARKNYDAAADNYRKALQHDQNSAFAGNNLAWLYAEHGKGNLDEAVRLAQGVVQRNPNVPGFADTLGWIYYKKGLFGPAVDQLQKTVALDESLARKNNANGSPSFHYHLGMALISKGDKPAAKREIEQALSLGAKPNMQFGEADEARKALSTL
jgi:tetratricopeptide (TPR) repeat protein